MPTRSERTAILFLSGVLAAGALVRVARAVQTGEKPPPAAQQALAAQRRVIDSAQRLRGARLAVPPPPVRARVARAPRAPVPLIRFPIDLDRADSAVIDALPGIGPAMAQRIVAQRDSFGAFGSLAQFEARVRGVGPSLARRIERLVTFSGIPRARSP
jgi:competence protein ComEA